MKVLVCWIGTADLRGPDSTDRSDVGPIANALAARSFDRAVLLSNQEPSQVERFVKWLKLRTQAQIEVERAELTSPTNFGEIYQAAMGVLSRDLPERGCSPDASLESRNTRHGSGVATPWED